MKLKILHVSQSVNPKHGGPIEGIRQQALAHATRGHCVEIVSSDFIDSDYLDFPGVKVIAMRNPGNYFYILNLYRWLVGNARHYDAIIVNGIWGLHLVAVSLALRNQLVPYFVFAHGMLDPWFKYRYPMKHFKKWLIWPLFVYPSLRDAYAVFFTCEREAVLARESFWLYDCNEAVIRYGTAGIPDFNHDYSTVFLDRHPTLLEKQRFLFLGRVHPKKGPDILVKAIASLQSKGLWNPDHFILVFAGPNDTPYAKQILKLAHQLGVFDSIYWTGMITGDEKWGAFQSSDAFVLPSHQENFGIAVAEALSCGVPVLTTHAVNISPEIVKYGAGFVEDDTLQGCLKMFGSWFDLPTEERLYMRSAARTCFMRRFHISHTSASITRWIYLSKVELCSIGLVSP